MKNVTAVLQLGERQSLLVWLPEGPRFEVALGFGHIGGRDWQGPLSAWRVEDAIQHVEDAIEPWSRLSARKGLLAVDAQALARLAEAGAGPDAPSVWPADAVEQAYQRLAMRATRGEAAMADPAQDATVLILRECLHHGGFEGLVAAA
jgi:hypothetical protein